MADVQQVIERWIEKQGSSRLMVGGLGAATGSAAGMWFIESLIADAALATFGGTALVCTALAWRLNAKLTAMPLEFAPTLVSGVLDARPALWVRACLGRGRALTQLEITARYVSDAGTELQLEPLMPTLRRSIGPVTVAIVDRDRKLSQPGVLTVKMQAREGRTVHEAEASWALGDAVEGRFSAGWTRRNGRWEPDVIGWRQLR